MRFERYKYKVGAAIALYISGLTFGCFAQSFTDADIGSVGAAGSATAGSQNSYTVSGSGGDIYSWDDACNFYSESVSSDNTLVAKVSSVTPTNPWTKAGLMIRQGNDPGSVYFAILITPGNGLSFQYRTSGGGDTTSSSYSGSSAPIWLKLVQAGNAFTAYYSNDGINWTSVGSATLNMTGSEQAGLVITSHDYGSLATAVFNNFSVGEETGNASTAFGTNTIASGFCSTAFGYQTTATGDYSTSSGSFTQASALGSFVIGSGNIGGGSPTQWVATDPLFEIGNAPGLNSGAPPSALSDAFIVYKNGNAILQGSLNVAPGGNIPMYTGQ